MALENRIEAIPKELLYIDLASFLMILPLLVVAGNDVLVLAAAVPIVALSLGAYELEALSPRRPLNAHHHATIAVCIAFSLVKSPELLRHDLSSLRAVSLFFGSACGITVVRRIIAEDLLSGTRKAARWLPKRFSPLVKTFESFIAITDYPANMQARGDVPTVHLSSLPRFFPEDPDTIDLTFDPLAFFRSTARALPPEVLSLFPNHIDLVPVPSPGYRLVKRTMDVLISILAIGLTIPLWVFASIGILISDGPEVFFVQTRVGQNRRPFRIIKFRTLRSIPAPSSPTDKIARRTFRFGALLRKLRIDELPQLLNVILEQMSVVGPRPEMIYYHNRSVSRIPYHEHRLHAKPGLTGWAQVRFPHSTTEEEYLMKTAYDLWYVQNQGIALDLYICLRTIGVLLQRFGGK